MLKRILVINGATQLKKREQQLINGGAEPCTMHCGFELYCDCNERCPERWENYRCYSTKAPLDVAPGPVSG